MLCEVASHEAIYSTSYCSHTALPHTQKDAQLIEYKSLQGCTDGTLSGHLPPFNGLPRIATLSIVAF
jgi:hypothetical protein